VGGRNKGSRSRFAGFRNVGRENAIAASGGMDNIVSIFSSRTFFGFIFFLVRKKEEGGRRGGTGK
jgi:hypothetical protein